MIDELKLAARAGRVGELAADEHVVERAHALFLCGAQIGASGLAHVLVEEPNVARIVGDIGGRKELVCVRRGERVVVADGDRGKGGLLGGEHAYLGGHLVARVVFDCLHNEIQAAGGRGEHHTYPHELHAQHIRVGEDVREAIDVHVAQLVAQLDVESMLALMLLLLLLLLFLVAACLGHPTHIAIRELFRQTVVAFCLFF